VRSGDLAFLLLWVLGGGTVAACVGLTWWGLFGDRGRGRRRCPHCWYDLSHSPGLVCPECGRAARGERHLHRTRRRLLPAAAAAVVASVGATLLIEHMQANGWLSSLPGRVLIASLPVAGGSPRALTVELSKRLFRASLTDGERRALLDRCLRGDHWARPVSPEWEAKYGGLLEECGAVLGVHGEIDQRLLELPARIELSSGRTWPVDAPLCLELSVRDWWPPETECRIRLTPRWDGAEPVTLWRRAMRISTDWGGRARSRPYPLVIQPPSPPRSTLPFTVELDRRKAGGQDTWAVVQRQDLDVDVASAGVLSRTLRPSVATGLDDAIRSAFSLGVVKWTAGRSPVRVRFDARSTEEIDDEDLAVGVTVDILFDDAVARRLDLWWPVGLDVSGGDPGWVVRAEDETLITRATDADGRWRLRVRGDPAVALRAGEGSTYWAGEFTVPLAVTERPGTAPPKFWWRLHE
jgi:hypothetical protein